MIFFTSDHHFYHENVIKYSNRPYKTISEMNDDLVIKWNKTVERSDTVYYLGDMFLTNYIPAIDFILAQLHGKIIFIKGNHDKWLSRLPRLAFKSKISSVLDYAEVKIGDPIAPLIVCAHYPFLTWNKSHFGSINLHGHCHGKKDTENLPYRRIDVGVDSMHSNGFPLSLDKVLSIASRVSVLPSRSRDDGD